MHIFPVLIFFPFFLFVMSFNSYLSPFGWIRLFPFFVAAVLLAILYRGRQDLAKRIGLWLPLTYLMDLAAWLISKREIAPETARLDWVGAPSMFRAGFPIHWLEVPPSPMGGDIPPSGEWWVVAANLAFWAALAGVMVFAPRVRDRLDNRFFRWFLARPLLGLLFAFLMNQALLGMFLLWFD